jgi:hypothetical protein
LHHEADTRHQQPSKKLRVKTDAKAADRASDSHFRFSVFSVSPFYALFLLSSSITSDL